MTLIEDVITTGGAVRAAAVSLREAGATVDVVVCAIDRSKPGDNHLNEIDVQTRAVLTLADLDRAAGSR